MRNFPRIIGIALLSICFIGGCGGSGGSDPNPQPPITDTSLDWDDDNWDEKDWQ